jgi:hypothetical protein
MAIYRSTGVYRLDEASTSGSSTVQLRIQRTVTGNPDNNDLVQVTACMRGTADSKKPKVKFIDDSGNAIGAHYCVTYAPQTAVTNVSNTTSNTEIELIYGQNMGNNTPTVGSLNTGLFTGEFLTFKMNIMLNRNSSAPISRAAGWWHGNYRDYNSTYKMTHGGFYLYQDAKPRFIEFGFYDGSTNVAGFFTSYEILGNRDT